MEVLFFSSCLELMSKGIFLYSQLATNKSDQELLQNSWAVWHFQNATSSRLRPYYKIIVMFVFLLAQWMPKRFISLTWDNKILTIVKSSYFPGAVIYVIQMIVWCFLPFCTFLKHYSLFVLWETVSISHHMWLSGEASSGRSVTVDNLILTFQDYSLLRSRNFSVLGSVEHVDLQGWCHIRILECCNLESARQVHCFQKRII